MEEINNTKTKKILLCEDTLEGIFSAVYDGWKYGNTCQVCLHTGEIFETEFFAEYEQIVTDSEKAQKVVSTIRRKLGADTWEQIGYCTVAKDSERGTAVFQTLWKALAHGRCRRDIMKDLADPYVNRVFKLYRKVWHEYHRFLGFVRFTDINGVLFSGIAPENDILELLGPHFQNRYPGESWMILDKNRNKLLLHPSGGECVIRREVYLKDQEEETPLKKDPYEQLWREFCRSITIEARRNPSLQQQFLPKKFQANMTEFRK